MDHPKNAHRTPSNDAHMHLQHVSVHAFVCERTCTQVTSVTTSPRAQLSAYTRAHTHMHAHAHGHTGTRAHGHTCTCATAEPAAPRAACQHYLSICASRARCINICWTSASVFSWTLPWPRFPLQGIMRDGLSGHLRECEGNACTPPATVPCSSAWHTARGWCPDKLRVNVRTWMRMLTQPCNASRVSR